MAIAAPTMLDEINSETQESEIHPTAHFSPDQIINGEDAPDGLFPSAGAMLMTGTVFGQNIETLVCSSTLIAPDVVMLAAHCLDDAAFTFGFGEVTNKRVYWTRQADLQEWNGSSPSPQLPEDAIEAASWSIHEGFDLMSMEIGIAENDDIALLFLAEAVDEVSPALLPTSEESQMIAEGDDVDVVGWGQSLATGQFESPPPGTYAIMQYGTSTIAKLGQAEFQVGVLETDVRKCHGDSGGPSYWEGPDGVRVIGVTSHAYDESDCFETGGVDTRVDHYFGWINEQMQSACADGTRVWCEETGIILPPADNVEAEDEGKALACNNTPSGQPVTIWLLSLLAVIIGRRK